MSPSPLLLPHFDAWQSFFQQPSPRFAALWQRFEARLVADDAFRHSNLFLSALLGREPAVSEARQIILDTAGTYAADKPINDTIENHTWCAAPNVMRLAVFYNWLRLHGIWSRKDTEEIAASLLHFCYEHVVAVLRSRVPSGDNQSLSMALTCAVVGRAFSDTPSVVDSAQELEAFGYSRLQTCLGLVPPDGYGGEGATYQSHVVSPIIMWTAAYLQQRDGTDIGNDILERVWQPSGVTLAKILRVESLMSSPGNLLWPLDHYGWHQKTNLAANAAYARLSGDASGLNSAEAIWDTHDFIAWSRDDRMWALLYWPEQDAHDAQGGLGGWSLPRTAAALDHRESHSRLLLAWDASSTALQGITRSHVNPNHIIYERAGEPLFADGASADPTFLGVDAETVAQPLTPEVRGLLRGQYGNLDNWLGGAAMGLLGASNTLLPIREAGYFPPHGAHGSLFWERREPDSHVVTTESVDYYPERLNLSRARRTVAMNADGIVWIVDDYRGQQAEDWVWQCYLRRECRLGESCVWLDVPGAPTTLAWSGLISATVETVSSFPAKGNNPMLAWPQDGSCRLRLWLAPKTYNLRVLVCILPFIAEQVSVEPSGDWSWRAEWPGGESTFDLPEEALRPEGFPIQSGSLESVEDLDDPSFYPLDEPNEILLAHLDTAAPENWRTLTRTLQTLAQRGENLGLPQALNLLKDPLQRYQARSVAAWYIGRAGYAPAVHELRWLVKSPETNLGFRASWALRRIEKAL